MKICKTYRGNNKIESFYLICRNGDNKYQAVAFPWGRIDFREFDTEEEVFNEISNTVKERGLKTGWTDLYYQEEKIYNEP